MTPPPSRASSAQSSARSITVDPQHSRPRAAAAPQMATDMVPGIPRRGRDYAPVRTEKERHAARLQQQDMELAAIMAKAGPPPSKEEFERERNEARKRKAAADLETTLLTKLLVSTDSRTRSSVALRPSPNPSRSCGSARDPCPSPSSLARTKLLDVSTDVHKQCALGTLPNSFAGTHADGPARLCRAEAAARLLPPLRPGRRRHGHLRRVLPRGLQAGHGHAALQQEAAGGGGQAAHAVREAR